MLNIKKWLTSPGAEKKRKKGGSVHLPTGIRNCG